MATKVDQTAAVPALEFIGFIHEGVPCKRQDLAACIEFYQKVLGLKLLPRPKALDAIAPGAWLGDAHDRVQFHLIAKDDEYAPGADAGAHPAGRHTAWMVKDIAAFRARMRALGVRFSEIASLIGAPQVFIVDPSGHTWEFQEPMKR
jgi:catechol 2,3-dioxygenase-like lactoylglutathione lyase family enzyme